MNELFWFDFDSNILMIQSKFFESIWVNSIAKPYPWPAPFLVEGAVTCEKCKKSWVFAWGRQTEDSSVISYKHKICEGNLLKEILDTPFPSSFTELLPLWRHRSILTTTAFSSLSSAFSNIDDNMAGKTTSSFPATARYDKIELSTLLFGIRGEKGSPMLMMRLNQMNNFLSLLFDDNSMTPLRCLDFED